MLFRSQGVEPVLSFQTPAFTDVKISGSCARMDRFKTHIKTIKQNLTIDMKINLKFKISKLR